MADDLRAEIEALRRPLPHGLSLALDEVLGWNNALDALLAAHPVQDEGAGECPFDRTCEVRDEWGIQWDGDPKMGGGYHVQGLGQTWPTEAEARTVADRALNRKPSQRIVHRVASSWTVVTDRPEVTP